MDHETSCFSEVNSASKRRRTSHKDVEIMDLPRVIMVEILSRLPVKSILQSKCVCKPWYSYSSDPLFAKLYHLRSSPFPCLLLSVKDSVSSILELKAHYDYDSDPQNRPVMLRPTSVNFGDGFVKPKLKLIGSCNGFVCLLNGNMYAKDHSVYVSNPLLCEYFKLNLPEWDIRVCRVIFGFCFSGRYKVLRSVSRNSHGLPEVSDLEVYTLGVDNQWRNVGKAPNPRYESFGSVNVNGSLNWMYGEHSEKRIYSFDIGTEKVTTMSPPPGLENRLHTSGLVELRNCLCYIDTVSYYSRYSFGIWMMKEYGVCESWTKCCYLSMTGFIPPCISCDIKPIAIWKDGEILMQSGRGKQLLVSYNPTEDRFRRVRVYGGGGAATRFVPSFYSLKTVLGDNFQVSNVFPKTETN